MQIARPIYEGRLEHLKLMANAAHAIYMEQPDNAPLARLQALDYLSRCLRSEIHDIETKLDGTYEAENG